MSKSTVSLCCSLYAYKGDTERVRKTVEWYTALTEMAGHPFRLLLVNDFSDESFEPIIPYITTPRGYCTSVEYFESDRRLGKAMQLNRVMLPCTDEHLGIIDNDVILPEGWLDACIKISNYKGIGACGVLVEDLPSALIEADFQLPFRVPKAIGGACLVWNRKKIGLEGYLWAGGGLYGHEDADFVQRISKRIAPVVAVKGRGFQLTSESDSNEYIEWKKKYHEMTFPSASIRFEGL
jgi:hypothetical protein